MLTFEVGNHSDHPVLTAVPAGKQKLKIRSRLSGKRPHGENPLGFPL